MHGGRDLGAGNDETLRDGQEVGRQTCYSGGGGWEGGWGVMVLDAALRGCYG